jgi:hypothetical protein
MKRIKIAIWIFVVILALCLAELFVLHKISQNIYQNLENTKRSIMLQNPAMAQKFANDLEAGWQNEQKILSSFMEHIKLEYVGQSLAALQVDLKEGQKEEALVELAKIREYIKTIRESEMPHIYNLL